MKVSDEAIAKIEPVINCNFSKDELNVLIDGFVAMQERKEAQVQKILSSGEVNISTLAQKKEFSKLSPAEEKMIAMLAGGACTIPNQDELMQNFTDLIMQTELNPDK